jgi:ABC-type tungstate transport system permease subunit
MLKLTLIVSGPLAYHCEPAKMGEGMETCISLASTVDCWKLTARMTYLSNTP